MKRIALRALVGLGLGLGFALLEFVVLNAAESAFHDHTSQPLRSFDFAFGILNAPAEWLARLWMDVLHLPPHSELAWIVVPVTCVAVQWGLIGFVGGLWWGFKSAPSASNGMCRTWLLTAISVGGFGLILTCGLLVLSIASVRSRPAQPDDSADHVNLGMVAYEQGRIEEAITEYRMALEVRPNDAEAHYRLGLALTNRDKTIEAMAHFRMALQLKPDYVNARQSLDQAREKAKKLGQVQEGLGDAK
jgi:tetratricopeptide (TPR) repeat protein